MEDTRRWRRWVIVLLALVGSLVVGTTWFGSSTRTVETFPDANRILLVNDAGPVRVRSMASFDGVLDQSVSAAGIIVRSSQSWLVRSPRIESATEGQSMVVRATCPTRLPCRVAVEIFVPPGIQLSVVAARDMVQVDNFDGALSIFAGEEGVVLGSVSGSTSIVSDGPVRGGTLGPTELTIEVVDDPVELTYIDPPMLLSVSAGTRGVLISVPTDEDYLIDAEAPVVTIGIDSTESSERLISVRAGGTVSIDATS